MDPGPAIGMVGIELLHSIVMIIYLALFSRWQKRRGRTCLRWTLYAPRLSQELLTSHGLNLFALIFKSKT